MKKQNTRKRNSINDLTFIVDPDNVFLLTKEGEELILNENEIEKPRILNVFPFSIPIFIYKRFIKRKKMVKKDIRSSNDDKDIIKNDINNINDDNNNNRNVSRRRKKEQKN